MRTDPPIVLSAANLSHLWAKAFLHTLDNASPSPILATLCVGGGNVPREDPRLRSAVSQMLLSTKRGVDIEDNAFMIFPEKWWARCKSGGRGQLYEMYGRLLPRLMARDSRNRNGTYFGRMIGWRGTRRTLRCGTNQIEHLLSLWIQARGRQQGVRVTALQIACFDPEYDLTRESRRGFPCLQQVGVSYEREGLVVHAFYPRQYLFDRGYGNYLGLCRLGKFLAEEIGISFARLNCLVAVPTLGEVQKSRLAGLAEAARALVASEGVDEGSGEENGR